MVAEEIRRKRDALAGAPDQVNWCDDGRIDDENMQGAGPGGWLNVFGWHVVGTTIGGNAIVVRVDDPAVYYAGHEWCRGDKTVDYEDFGGGGKGKWVSVPFTADGVRQSLFQFAPSIDEFRERRMRSTRFSTRLIELQAASTQWRLRTQPIHNGQPWNVLEALDIVRNQRQVVRERRSRDQKIELCDRKSSVE